MFVLYQKLFFFFFFFLKIIPVCKYANAALAGFAAIGATGAKEEAAGVARVDLREDEGNKQK